jgi:DNA-binding HxlR family transcriptional regulator
MLSERLKELETEGIVVRLVTPDTPVRVEYELTRKGRALDGALAAVAAWADEWQDAPAGAKTQARARAIRA